MLEETEGAMKNEQSRNPGNIKHTRLRTYHVTHIVKHYRTSTRNLNLAISKYRWVHFVKIMIVDNIWGVRLVVRSQ
jgi:hypothetical protein